MAEYNAGAIEADLELNRDPFGAGLDAALTDPRKEKLEKGIEVPIKSVLDVAREDIALQEAQAIADKNPVHIRVLYEQAAQLNALPRATLETIAKAQGIPYTGVYPTKGDLISEMILAGGIPPRAPRPRAGGSGGGGGGGGLGLLGSLGWGSGIFGLAGIGSILGLAGLSFEHVATTALGLGGSLVGAGLGGALLGGTALGIGAVGAGTNLAGIGQATGDIQKVIQAQNQLNQAVQQYGKNSTQAAVAQANYNYVLGGFSPIARVAVVQAADTLQQFKQLFDQYTGLAEKIGAQIITQGIKVAEKFLPTIGQFAAQNMAILMKGLQPFFAWLSGPGIGFLVDFEEVFQHNFPTAIHIFEQVFELIAKVMFIADNYLGGILPKIDEFVTKWNDPKNFTKVASGINTLVGIFHTWFDFAVSVGKVIFDVFKPVAGTGTEIVRILTSVMDSLDKWIKSPGMQGTLKGLFGAHYSELQQVGGILLGALPIVESFLQSFLKLTTVIVRIAVDILKPIGDLVKAIGGSPDASSLLGNVALGGLLARRFGQTGAGFSGLASRAGYGAIGGAFAGSEIAGAAGLHGGAATALTVGGIGLGVLPQIPAMLKTVEGALTHFSARAVSTIGPAIGSFARFGGAVLSVGSTLLTFATGPVGLVILGLILLGAGIYLLVTHWKESWATIKKVFDEVVAFLRTGLGTLAILLVLGPVGALLILALHWQQIWLDIRHWSADAWHFLDGVWQGMDRDARHWFGDVEGFFKTVWHDIYSAVTGAAKSVYTFLDGIWQNVDTDVRHWFGNVLTFFKNLPGNIVHAIGDLGSLLINAGQRLIQGFINGIGSMAGAIGGAITSLVNHIPGVHIDKSGLKVFGIHVPGSSLFGAAKGTDYWPGGLGWVGEQGPELALLPVGTKVFPASQSRRMAATMGMTYAPTYKISISGTSEQIVQQVQGMLNNHDKQFVDMWHQLTGDSVS